MEAIFGTGSRYTVDPECWRVSAARSRGNVVAKKRWEKNHDPAEYVSIFNQSVSPSSNFARAQVVHSPRDGARHRRHKTAAKSYRRKITVRVEDSRGTWGLNDVVGSVGGTVVVGNAKVDAGCGVSDRGALAWTRAAARASCPGQIRLLYPPVSEEAVGGRDHHRLHRRGNPSCGGVRR